MLQFDFMRKALLAGLMISIMIPLIGVVMVNRKTSMVGDALSHTSLAGVGMGLILGMEPGLGAIIVCVLAAFAIEMIRKRFPHYGDMATAVIMSAGLGAAAVLSDLAPGGNTFESYLFGSISSVTQGDVGQVGAAFALVLGASFICYNALMDIAVDGNLARMAGVRVKWVSGVFTLLSAVSIALACKIVGALLAASLMVLPVAMALIISRSYKQTVLLSVLFGVADTMGGITISYYFDVKPGGAIVLLAVLGMLLMTLFGKIKKRPARSA